MTTPEELDALVARLLDGPQRVYRDLHAAKKAANAITALRARVAELEARATRAEAELTRRGQGVRVKPLKWNFFDVSHEFGMGVWDANTVDGVYTIQDCSSRPEIGPRYYVPRIAASFVELDDAKAAAQADYEARIRAALVSPGDGPAIKDMVSRFLQWKLPSDFAPDGGVSFKAVSNEGTPHEYRHVPVGTNLLNAVQAEAMIRHLLSAPASEPSEYEKKVAQMKEDFPNGI